MKEEFRTVELIEPEEITLSRSEIEKLLLRISEELINYRDYIEKDWTTGSKREGGCQFEKITLDSIVEAVNELPALPHVVVRIMQLSEDPDSTVQISVMC